VLYNLEAGRVFVQCPSGRGSFSVSNEIEARFTFSHICSSPMLCDALKLHFRKSVPLQNALFSGQPAYYLSPVTIGNLPGLE
jgi:hypothetical protein